LKSVQNGQLSATVAQQPDLIGEKAIEASKQIANKESIPPQMPVALKLVTK
jgi:ribose transport system substrate-binding protein